ncbi:MAG TPA: hypothetical protein PLS84_11760 [Salinivirgaceae bacterium]|mgnify:FL=1|nr:hypothetical protein [Salinivirgaceae bacterium]
MLKRKDLFFILGCIVFITPFFISETVYNVYVDYNKNHGMIMSFVKFSILATAGEVIGLRIRTGNYNQKGFGIIPRAIVWGFLGLTIKMAFVIFSAGTPELLSYLGLENARTALAGDFTTTKLFVAFMISTTMNVVFAPIMMTLHKITDTHIVANGGAISALFKPIKFRKIFNELNWDVQWNFVFKKTIPLFWIPAHTITFLLPNEFQVLFAALLGVALGVILAIAAQMGKK